MGAVELVPGFSSGTMAFILGIYHKMLDAVQAFDLVWLRLLKQRRFKEAMSRIPWNFLLPLLMGMLLAVFSLANLTLYIMDRWPGQVWSFFIGLILAAIYWVLSTINMKNPWTWLCLILGFIACVVLNNMGGINLGHSLPIMFFSGFLAVCAMILPGISGAFVLVLINQYEYILSAIASFNLPALTTLALGILAGLGSFARVVGWLLKRFYSPSMAALTGLMAGCILLIWPWQAEGKLTLPPAYDFSFLICLALLAVGIVLPMFFQHLAKNGASQPNETI